VDQFVVGMETVQLSFNRPGMASDAFYAKLNISRRTEKICRAVSNQTCPEEKLSAGAGAGTISNSIAYPQEKENKRSMLRQAIHASRVKVFAEKN
jgi:hypothetical protein